MTAGELHGPPRLVALDIDGTLVDGREYMSPATIEAVTAARAAGAHVVLSTGRSTFGMTHIMERLGLDGGLSVASNGAVTFSYWPIEIIDEVTFDASQTVNLLLEHVPDALVAVEEIGRGYRVSAEFPDGEITGEMFVETVDELVAKPVHRVIIRDPSQSAEEFVALAERLGLHGTNYFVGYTAWLDLAPDGVSKASALAGVCARLGIDRAETLAIGDGRNDIEMLEWAGRGVAMGGSPPEVVAAADVEGATLADDGVARELSRWFGPGAR